MPGVTFSGWTIIPPTSTIQDDLSQRNKQLHTIRRSFSKFQMTQQTPTISQLTRLHRQIFSHLAA
jgi:hypothetical protein